MFVDAGYAPPHKAIWIELPVFVSVSPEPATAIIAVFVREPRCYPIVGEGPEFLDKPIVKFFRPLAREKRLNGGSARQKLNAVLPEAVDCVSKRHPSRLAAIPIILDDPDFF